MKNGYELTAAVHDAAQTDKFNFIQPTDCQNLLSSPIYVPITDNTALYTALDEHNQTIYIRFRDLSPAEKNFYMQHVHLDVGRAVSLACDTENQKGKNWLHQRKIRITSSCAYPFVTYVTNKSPNWDNKIMKHLNNEFQGNESTNHGVQSEPKARVCYERKTGLTVVQAGLLVNPCVSWLGYSPDGIVLNENKIIEIKCPANGKTKGIMEVIASVKWISNANGILSLKDKHKYYCQVQLGMFVTNTSSCDFIIYSPFDNDCVIIPVPFNREKAHGYIRNLQFVYFRYLLKHVIDINATDACNKTNGTQQPKRLALRDMTNNQ